MIAESDAFDGLYKLGVLAFFGVCVYLLWDAFRVWKSPEFDAEVKRMKRDGEANRRREEKHRQVERQKRAGWWNR